MSQRVESERVISALRSPAASVRLKAALRAGSMPDPEYIGPLVDRCAVEPEFFVRDMLTWALIQNDHQLVIDRLMAELVSDVPQARAQALHTFSKLGDGRVWPAITSELLADTHDDVARAAWRTAASLVPAGSERWLAETLATQWGRGHRDVQLSLSQAFVVLGGVATDVVADAIGSDDEDVRAHALATRQLIDNPDLGFDTAVDEARRIHALRGAPTIEE